MTASFCPTLCGEAMQLTWLPHAAEGLRCNHFTPTHQAAVMISLCSWWA